MSRSRRRVWIAAVIIGVLSTTTLATVYAATGNRDVTVAYRDITLWVHGKQVQTDGVEPFILDDRTYVPARRLAESLGADVSWDADNKRVIINGRVLFKEMTLDTTGCNAKVPTCKPHIRGWRINQTDKSLSSIGYGCNVISADGTVLGTTRQSVNWAVGPGPRSVTDVDIVTDSPMTMPIPSNLKVECDIVHVSFS